MQSSWITLENKEFLWILKKTTHMSLISESQV